MFNKNKKSLCSNKIALEIRIRIFEALVSSIFLYNAELWTLKSTDIIKIDTFQRAFLRQIVRTKRIHNTLIQNNQNRPMVNNYTIKETEMARQTIKLLKR